MSTYMY